MDFAPLIGALGAVGSGLITANSIDEQNALAASQFRENMAFQRYQYEDMKRYQSPANQVRLLREANVNPALGMDSKLAGNALSSVGGVSPTASHAVGDFSPLLGGFSSLVDSLNTDSLAQSEQARNFADAAKSLQESLAESINNMYRRGDKELGQRLTKLEGDVASWNALFLGETFGRRVEQEQFKSALLMSQMEAQAISNKYLPEKFQKEFGLLLAQTSAARAAGRLSDEQATEVIARKLATYGLTEDDALELFDDSLDLIDSQVSSNTASAFNTFKGDIKTNPFTLSIGAYHAGQAINNYNSRHERRYLRRKYRDELRKKSK